jgi:hypothetical protein
MRIQFSKIAAFLIFTILLACYPKSNLFFYVPNSSRENLINDLKKSGLDFNEDSDKTFEIENLNNKVQSIEISVGDFDSNNKTVEVELVSIDYKTSGGKLSIDELSEEEKEEFKEIFSNKVLPYILKIE